MTGLFLAARIRGTNNLATRLFDVSDINSMLQGDDSLFKTRFLSDHLLLPTRVSRCGA